MLSVKKQLASALVKKLQLRPARKLEIDVVSGGICNYPMWVHIRGISKNGDSINAGCRLLHGKGLGYYEIVSLINDVREDVKVFGIHVVCD